MIDVRAFRRSPHSSPIDQNKTLADEIQEWLKRQVSVQVGWGGIQGLPSKSWVRASMAVMPFLRVVER